MHLIRIFSIAGRVFTLVVHFFCSVYFFLWILAFLGISFFLLGVFSFLFLIAGFLFSSVFGISSHIFWGDFLDNFNQIFSVNKIFLSWYDYWILGFWGLSLSLFLIYCILLALSAFVIFLISLFHKLTVTSSQKI